jgi:hypothetical protein
VAEITGRTRRLVTLPDGSQRLGSRTGNQSLADANAFMGGAKRILVFSDAGGTGRSYHASLDAKNQQRRMHFLLEPGWRADRAIQGSAGPIRTHQASAPVFRPVTTDCRGERRFISTIARRLDALGALTRGQRQTGGQNLFDPADNLESDYAREALTRWYHLLHQGKLTSIGFADFCERTGLQLEQEGCLTDNLPPIQRWLNRILALPIALQNAVFDEFLGLVEARIDAARKAGTFDAGVETLVADKLTIIEERILREDANGASTQLLTLEAQWAPKFTPLAEIVKRIGPKTRLLRNGRSSRVALLMPDRTRLMDDGTPVASFTLHRPGGEAGSPPTNSPRATGMIASVRPSSRPGRLRPTIWRPNPIPSASTSRPAACCRSGTCWAMRRRSAASSPRMAGPCWPHCARRSGQHAARQAGHRRPHRALARATGRCGAGRQGRAHRCLVRHQPQAFPRQWRAAA